MKTKRILMLMFASAALLFASCEKETKEDTLVQQTTTYTVNVSGIDVPSGMALEFLVFEYSSDNERIQVNRFDWTSSYMSNSYTANSHTEKVKVAYTASNPGTGQSATRWVQQVFYLDKGKNTIININGNSTVGISEP